MYEKWGWKELNKKVWGELKGAGYKMNGSQFVDCFKLFHFSTGEKQPGTELFILLQFYWKGKSFLFIFLYLKPRYLF